jgi:hypothetical protein
MKRLDIKSSFWIQVAVAVKKVICVQKEDEEFIILLSLMYFFY